MRRDAKLNVFCGPTALRDFLDPDEQPMLPLVEIPECLNPLYGDGVRIYAKLMNFLPLANIKSLPALSMVLEKEKNGRLDEVTTLIENSSGNTIYSLAVIARIFGIPTAKAFVSHQVSRGKLQLLRFFGIEITVNQEPICPDPGDRTSGIHKARKSGSRPGWWNPGQYENEANPEAHRRWTGPQILKQTAGEISVFCAGLGTTGTMYGTGGFLKKHVSGIFNLGVIRKPNNPVPGVRTNGLLRQIAFPWPEAVDATIEVGTKESFEHSLKLCRHGIMVGPSSGFALAGLSEFLEEKKAAGELGKFRNKNGEVAAVFICPDSPFPYVDEYFTYLDGKLFPKIENEHLLENPPLTIVEKSGERVWLNEVDADPAEAFQDIYGKQPDVVWEDLQAGCTVVPRKGVLVIDLRDSVVFGHFHLPGSKQTDYISLADQIEKAGELSKVFVVCGYGERSRVAASLLRRQGIEAYSLRGGMLEWSKLDLPRQRPVACVKCRSGRKSKRKTH